MTYEDFEKVEINRDYYVNTDREFICEDESEAQEMMHECYLSSRDCSYDEDDWKWFTGEELLRKLLQENYDSKRSAVAQIKILAHTIDLLVKGE